jgi:Domain of unknown function (DU1801)
MLRSLPGSGNFKARFEGIERGQSFLEDSLMAVTAKKRAKSTKTVTPRKAQRAAGGAAARPRPRKAYAAKLKTVVTDGSVEEFLAGIAEAQQRADCQVRAAIFGTATRQAPRMWGGRIVGYGEYSYVGRSGRAGDWYLAGFAPQKGTLTLYMLGGWAHDPGLLAKLGKHSLGMGCLYLKRLADVDLRTLKALVASALTRAKALAPTMMNQGVR